MDGDIGPPVDGHTGPPSDRGGVATAGCGYSDVPVGQEILNLLDGEDSGSLLHPLGG